MTELDIFTPKPRISVLEARKLLGSKFKHLSDNQVIELVLTLTLIARKNLEVLGSKNTHGYDSIET